METVYGAILVVISLFIYFLPTFVAKGKKHPNFMSIFLLNFFLGWSLLGWVIALVWAVKNEKSSQPTPVSHVSAGDEIAKLKALMEDGAITYDEFEAKKKSILSTI